jgi:uncharacterized SAM-binding protein YcdF (DUF218 family)
MRTLPRLSTVLVALGLIVVLGAIAVFVFGTHRTDKPIKADAVVVLAGTIQRLPVGVELVRQGYAPLLVVSLSAPTSHQQAAICDHKQRYRVLCFRADPFETRGEARAIGRFARERHWKKIDVVTSYFHIPRARVLIQRCYHGELRMIGAPESRLHLPVDILKESGKLLYQELIARSC